MPNTLNQSPYSSLIDSPGGIAPPQGVNTLVPSIPDKPQAILNPLKPSPTRPPTNTAAPNLIANSIANPMQQKVPTAPPKTLSMGTAILGNRGGVHDSLASIKAGRPPANRYESLRDSKIASDESQDSKRPIKVNLIDVRQRTTWTCGPAALESVASSFGAPATEKQIARLAHTSEDYGTAPDELFAVAKKLGIHATLKEHITIPELKSYLDEGKAVICDIQAWGTQAEYDNNESGHYVVAVGYDDDNFYFEDPSLKGELGELPIQEFEARWKDQEDDARGGAKTNALGIICTMPDDKAVPKALPKTEKIADDEAFNLFQRKKIANPSAKIARLLKLLETVKKRFTKLKQDLLEARDDLSKQSSSQDQKPYKWASYSNDSNGAASVRSQYPALMDNKDDVTEVLPMGPLAKQERAKDGRKPNVINEKRPETALNQPCLFGPGSAAPVFGKVADYSALMDKSAYTANPDLLPMTHTDVVNSKGQYGAHTRATPEEERAYWKSLYAAMQARDPQAWTHYESIVGPEEAAGAFNTLFSQPSAHSASNASITKLGAPCAYPGQACPPQQNVIASSAITQQPLTQPGVTTTAGDPTQAQAQLNSMNKAPSPAQGALQLAPIEQNQNNLPRTAFGPMINKPRPIGGSVDTMGGGGWSPAVSKYAALLDKCADLLPGGKGDDRPASDFDEEELEEGIKEEGEHTSNKAVAEEIAEDHLSEVPDYYTRLEAAKLASEFGVVGDDQLLQMLKLVKKLAPTANSLVKKRTDRGILSHLFGVQRPEEELYPALMDKQADYTINMHKALGPTIEPILGDYMGLRGGDMLGPFPPAKPWTDADIQGQMTRLTMARAAELLGTEKKADWKEKLLEMLKENIPTVIGTGLGAVGGGVHGYLDRPYKLDSAVAEGLDPAAQEEVRKANRKAILHGVIEGSSLGGWAGWGGQMAQKYLAKSGAAYIGDVDVEPDDVHKLIDQFQTNTGTDLAKTPVVLNKRQPLHNLARYYIPKTMRQVPSRLWNIAKLPISVAAGAGGLWDIPMAEASNIASHMYAGKDDFYTPGTGTVNTGKNFDPSVLAHELGHWSDYEANAGPYKRKWHGFGGYADPVARGLPHANEVAATLWARKALGDEGWKAHGKTLQAALGTYLANARRWGSHRTLGEWWRGDQYNSRAWKKELQDALDSGDKDKVSWAMRQALHSVWKQRGDMKPVIDEQLRSDTGKLNYAKDAPRSLKALTKMLLDREYQRAYPALQDKESLNKEGLAFCDLTQEELDALAEEQKRQYLEAGMDPDEIERNQYADLIG